MCSGNVLSLQMFGSVDVLVFFHTSSLFRSIQWPIIEIYSVAYFSCWP